ncbi:TonB-dependent receptor plug domain-containing protein [Opitutus terrae]|uniref:TonB-dependent receptor plug domain-containing protein n=1 Tax=Opitutus terrae TaxID=107709 RepID=UPI00030F47EB|nr:TonB-dependent receptor plug domain-containing protein [Opitutus terrae]
MLSPFEVSASDDRGYAAAHTLAGNRLNTDLRDIGNAVTVITSQLLKDVQATNNETLLQYTAGTEVGSIRGNFAGLGDGAVLNEADRFTRPNANTRVRGLAAADNTRDFFLSDIPWDSFNLDRVDLQRGPNSILFGLGSPAGLLNAGLKQAGFRDTNEVGVRVDNWGSVRWVGNFNKVILPNELAARVDVLHEKNQFQQEPAFEDNRRAYGAFRYEPNFLKKGSARTILKANFENGNVRSNRPRSLPPLDRITPWFYTGTYNGVYKGTGQAIIDGVSTPVTFGQTRVFNNLNRETFNPFQLQDDNTGRPNHGQVRPVINGGPDAGKFNPGYNPWVGNFANQFSGIDSFYVNGGAALPGSNVVWEDYKTRGISSTGAIDGSLGRSFQRPGGVATYDAFATNAGLPYYQYGLYKAVSLTDPTVFDFYNNLIDGPNKDEWNDWNAYNVSLAQTFMDDTFGFEANVQHEDFKRGQLALLTGSQQAIFIDINSVYNDGTPAGKNGEPFLDGTPNPNVGRPFISDSGQGGNTEYVSRRDALRLTGFFSHDFNRNGHKNLLTRILGKHILTGLYSKDKQETDNRTWARYSARDPNYLNFIGRTNFRFNAPDVSVNRIIYLGDSLSGRNTAAGSNIPRATARVEVPATLNVRTFDSTWTATNVNPADYWANEYYPNIPPFNLFDNPATTANERGAYNSFQSENPANYRGFVNIPVNIVDSEWGPNYRALLTTDAQRNKTEVTSKALVWQSYWWDKSIIGTLGYREDTAKAWGKSLTAGNTPVPGYLDLDKNGGYALPSDPINTIKAISRSYSVVTHVNDLPYLSKMLERLPIDITLFYNSSSNFQPDARRVDVYGEPLSPPSGKTIDRGILLETKDGKYSLKINKFITTLKDASSSTLGNSGFIGTSQQYGGNWANQFEYDLAIDNQSYIISHQANNRPAGAANPPGYTSTFIPGNPDFDPTNTLYNYGTDIGETIDQAQSREKAAVDAWRVWQKQVDPRFYAAWGINLNDLTKPIAAAQPQGFTVTEDSESHGYEIEFNANPTRNWRLTFNATQVNATRSNVGGANLREFITAYEKAIRTTAAGDLRIWWGGAGNDTTLRQWFNSVGSNWAQKALSEGTKASELREWRFNAITNYAFDEGALKGFNVGGGVRWQGKNALGNRPVGDPLGSDIAFDLANPYYGPAEAYFDLWVGYRRRLPRKVFSQDIEWNVQLNVMNVGKGNELIPVTVQPDGTPATYRISPHQQITLTNSFAF